MTVKNAIKLLEYYAEKKEEMKMDLLDRNKPWNYGEINLFSLSKSMAGSIEVDLVFLNEIKKQIKPDCKHPKKFHDRDSNGNTYCMGCNLDL